MLLSSIGGGQPFVRRLCTSRFAVLSNRSAQLSAPCTGGAADISPRKEDRETAVPIAHVLAMLVGWGLVGWWIGAFVGWWVGGLKWGGWVVGGFVGWWADGFVRLWVALSAVGSFYGAWVGWWVGEYVGMLLIGGIVGW